MLKRMLALVAVLGLTLSVGCTNTQRFMAGGAVVGGAIGGTLGAHGVWGLDNAGEGVLIGSLAGATAGGLVGSVVDYQKNKAEIERLQGEIDRLTAENKDLRDKLEAANRRIADLEAQLANMPKGRMTEVEISLGADVLFRSGSARLSDAGKRALDDAAAKLKSQYAGRFMMIEGHTDSDPIKASGWKSNWELGAARALTVLHYLNDKGVDPAKMSAASFSKYQPADEGTTKEAKAQNRRAVIVVYKNWTAAPKPTR